MIIPVYMLMEETACSFDPTKADACYNAARVLQTLASDFYDLASSAPALEKAIQLYRSAQTLDPTSIDVTYNLALALSDLGEWRSDKSTKAALWTEARAILEQVITQQLQSLSYASQANSAEAEDEEPDVEAKGDEEMQEEAEEVSTVVTEAVTPSDVVESLLSLANLLANARNLADDPAARDMSSADVTSVFARARVMVTTDTSNEIRAIQRAELGVAVSACEQAPIEVALQTLRSVLASYETAFASNTNDMELLSEYADATSTAAELYYPSDRTESSRLANLALSQYQQLIQSLSSPISRHGFAPNLVQPTLSTAFAQCGLLQLLLADPSSARELAIQAIQATGCGVSWQSNKFAKTEGRKDRSAWEALEFASVVFARIAYASKRDEKQAKDLLGKLKMGERLPALVEEEFVNDPLWNEGEELFWSQILREI